MTPGIESAPKLEKRDSRRPSNAWIRVLQAARDERDVLSLAHSSERSDGRRPHPRSGIACEAGKHGFGVRDLPPAHDLG